MLKQRRINLLRVQCVDIIRSKKKNRCCNLKTIWCNNSVPLCWGAGAAGDTEQADDTDPEGGNDRGQAEVTGGACTSSRARAHAHTHDIKLKGAAQGTR